MGKKLDDYEVFKDNPYSLDGDGFKRIVVPDVGIMDSATGEVVEKGKMIDVDKKPFVKVFKNGLPEMEGFSIRATRVLFRVMGDLRMGEDEVYINAASYAKHFGYKNTRDIYSGIKELMDKDFLSRKNQRDFYFINVRLLFNGDRVKYKREREK